MDKVKATVITPYWPSALWYPTIREMSIGKPLPVPRIMVRPAPGNTSGASPAVVKILYESTRVQKTAKGNSSAQLAFERWTHFVGVDPLEATAVHVMNYLAYGLETKGWSRATVRTYKSAILQLFSNEEREVITTNHDFQQFIKLAGTESFKRLRNYDIDMAPLLKHLHNLGSNNTMSITDLTAKTCFLLSVCGLLRADDIECVDVTQSTVKDNTLTLTVLFPKELRGGQNIIKPVVIKSHPKEECCPVRAYMEYRRRTETFDEQACKDHPKIASERYTPLIRFIKEPTRSLQHERISHYIHDIMRWIPKVEGQPKYKARAVGATMALKHGVPVEDVTTHGNWSSSAIVEQFYRLSRTFKNDFTSAILS
ncbi:hypothetical protein BG015_006225 [Linnemannia schmuckeri]|uniref:Uncharacterized protein n=1 Tax=Linnemannia schmuckeri TaxID=64567 RepID=A0A9P5R216_9FUNG|nr:hypothetical protein BG015_006225 [Linnemannia schmuckeri]